LDGAKSQVIAGPIVEPPPYPIRKPRLSNATGGHYNVGIDNEDLGRGLGNVHTSAHKPSAGGPPPEHTLGPPSAAYTDNRFDKPA